MTMQNLVVCFSYCVRTCRRSQNFGDAGARPLGMGRSWPQEICFSHLCHRTKFGHSRSNRTSLWTAARTFWSLASHLSSSLKVTGTDTHRSAIYNDFLLRFYSSHGSISYHFRYKKAIIAKISHPHVFNAPLKGFCLEFCNGAGAQITRTVPLPDCRKSVTTRPFV